jgi:hypothetical protein
MSASYLRLTKSETRELADRELHALSERRLGGHTEWHMRDSTFFVAFVVIASLVTIAALVLRA